MSFYLCQHPVLDGLTTDVIYSSQKDVNTSLSPAFRDAANKDKLLAVLDTGTALGYLPQRYFDAVFKGVPGFQALDKKLGVYTLPCDTKVNVSMVFKCVCPIPRPSQTVAYAAPNDLAAQSIR